jgi:hypothetical protein
MLKTIQWALVLLFFSATLGSCLKDYPKDIPDWLKEKIKGIEKKKKGACCCILDGCGSIEEWTDGSNTIFFWRIGTMGPSTFFVYDNDGNYQCTMDDWDHVTCPSVVNFNQYHFERLIWEEEYKDQKFLISI